MRASLVAVALIGLAALCMAGGPRPDRLQKLTVETARLEEEIAKLAEFTDDPSPAVTRIVYTETDVKARKFLKQLFSDAGLEVSEDPMGNTFARWSGKNPALAPVGTGSHIDAIPLAGRFDGVVGVLGALEAFRALKRAGYEPERALEIILFTSEEPTRFGLGCLGSRVLSRALAPEAAGALQDANGTSLNEARRAAGFEGELAHVPLGNGRYAAFVELHIEQGPLLEQEGLDAGVVTAIAAPATLNVEFEGPGGHAGSLLMPLRKDPLLAASELALRVEAEAFGTGARDTVATVGVLQVSPGAVNSVPRKVHLEIDVRDIDGARRDSVVERIVSAARDIGARRGVDHAVEVINADPPAACADELLLAARNACASLGLRCRDMPSRAYHDSLFMARIVPTAMLFIPCRGGVSHRPDEHASSESLESGVRLLAATLAKLASAPPRSGAATASAGGDAATATRPPPEPAAEPEPAAGSGSTHAYADEL